MGVLIEVTDGQSLHPLKDALAQAEHRTLRDVDHQTVVEIGTDYTYEQDDAEFEERLPQCRVFRIGGLS